MFLQAQFLLIKNSLISALTNFFNSSSKLNDLPGDANFLKANVERGEDLDGNEGAALKRGTGVTGSSRRTSDERTQRTSRGRPSYFLWSL